MDVGEKGKKAQDGDNLELDLVAPVRHALRHGVQPKEQVAEPQNGEHQNDAQHNHEYVCVTRSSDERRQMVGSSRVKLIHGLAPIADTSVPVPTFVSYCSTLEYERRNQRDTSNSMILVSRFRSSPHSAARSFANFGIE